MESTKCENNTIEHSKYILNLIIKGFKEFIDLYRFSTDEKALKFLRKALRKREKIVCDEKEDNIEYLKDNFNELKDLKNTYFNKNKYHDCRVKYFDTDETIRYLLEDDDEDYNIYKKNQQHQSFISKALLPLDEYLKKIRPELIKLMIKNYKAELNVNLVFGSKTNSNDECNVFIKTKSTDIGEIFDQLIGKHEDLTNINFLFKGVESITYNFIKIIIKKYFC